MRPGDLVELDVGYPGEYAADMPDRYSVEARQLFFFGHEDFALFLCKVNSVGMPYALILFGDQVGWVWHGALRRVR